MTSVLEKEAMLMYNVIFIVELVTTCQRIGTQTYYAWTRQGYDSLHGKGIPPQITSMPTLSTLTNIKALTFPHRVRKTKFKCKPNL